MFAGLIAIRKMHIHAIQESGFNSLRMMKCFIQKTIVIFPTFSLM